MPTASVFLNAAMLGCVGITKMRNTQGAEIRSGAGAPGEAIAPAFTERAATLTA